MMEKFLVNGGCVSKRRSLWECLVPVGNKVDSFRYLVCVKYPIWLLESILFSLREISNPAISIPMVRFLISGITHLDSVFDRLVINLVVTIPIACVPKPRVPITICNLIGDPRFDAVVLNRHDFSHLTHFILSQSHP